MKTFLFLKGSAADDNVLAVFASPSHSRLRESSGLARKTGHPSFGYQHFSSAFLVQYVRRDDHFQGGRLHKKKKKDKNSLSAFLLFPRAVICVTETVNVFPRASIMGGNKRQKIWQGGCTLGEELMATSFLFAFFSCFFTSHFPCTLDGIHQAHSFRWRGRFSRLRHWTTYQQGVGFSRFSTGLKYHVYLKTRRPHLNAAFHFGLLHKPHSLSLPVQPHSSSP